MSDKDDGRGTGAGPATFKCLIFNMKIPLRH